MITKLTQEQLIDKNRAKFYRTIGYTPNKSITNVDFSWLESTREIYKKGIMLELRLRLVTNNPFEYVEIGNKSTNSFQRVLTKDLLSWFDTF